MSTVSPLAESWNLGRLRIKNRIGMAPMSTNLAGRLGQATPSLIRHLVRRARGGCGMIMIESATVDSIRGGTGRNLRLDGPGGLPGLGALIREIHRFDCAVVVQLWHAGPRAHVAEGLPLSPSGAMRGQSPSRTMTKDEIETVVKQFMKAGDRAARAGCDVLEIHAAHGYLLHAFIDRVANRRRDSYGGTVNRRFRILAEIRAGLRRVRPKLPVILRLSLRADDDMTAIARAILNAGFDGVDVRTGFSSMPVTAGGGRVPAGYTLKMAVALRPHLSIPVMTGGRILTPEQAERALMIHGLDAVVLGRPLLADPAWARKALAGKPVSLCRYDCRPSCYDHFKKGEPLRCVVTCEGVR